MKLTLLSILAGALLLPALVNAAPKKLLVVTTTTEFRHSSIPLSETIIADLAKQYGTFTVDFIHQPDGKPTAKRNATAEDKAAFAAAEAQWKEKLKEALQKLSPDSLKNYDAVAFVSTTGDLPIPDPDGFLNWITNGGAFIGIHAASDTFHHWPGFIAMLGGEFDHHGQQVAVECLNEDPQHPATAHLGETWTIKQEEIYEFRNYDPAKVHDLLILDKAPQLPHAPGHFPVSWAKPYGKGKIFYTSLGHREDLWDTDASIKDRKNSEDISKAYQQHVLGGIEWALGVKPGK